jgi:hypothetical protein
MEQKYIEEPVRWTMDIPVAKFLVPDWGIKSTMA